LNSHAFEDVYYEHCAYFTAGSLARLFRRAGFEILDIEYEYDDQYLTIEAAPADGATPAALDLEDDLVAVTSAVDDFEQGCAKVIGQWRARLEKARAEGETVVLWGSGSKAVSFLTAVDPGRQVQYVTDINPHRHGHFMPKSGQRIVPPSHLAEIRPNLVIAMNRIYAEEIRKDLDAMGVFCALAAL
jgi:hypothetical protein